MYRPMPVTRLAAVVAADRDVNSLQAVRARRWQRVAAAVEASA
jgi:hypothetical protein